MHPKPKLVLNFIEKVGLQNRYQEAVINLTDEFEEILFEAKEQDAQLKASNQLWDNRIKQVTKGNGANQVFLD